jgi:hypothetical protein
VEVAVRSTRALEARPVESAWSGVRATPWLAAIVGLSFVVRTIVGWFRDAPVYFGDEYLYSELARSISETGRPLVRDHAADFPALLQPLLTAPAWLLDDVGHAYHAVQTLGALAMSLAAVPVFLLARRVGIGSGLALGLASLSLALPDLIYASWLISEPFAYPLALAAFAAGVSALAWPSRRAQLAFVALAALAAFARIQFVLLPACFVGAMLVAGLRERRLRAALREQALALVLLAVPLGAALVLGPSRVLAFYGGVVNVDIDPVAVADRSGPNLLVLLYSSGFVLVPGALLGLGLAIARPRSRAELAFAPFALLLGLALLVEAGLFGAFEQVQERYLFYVLPLLAVAFGLYAARGWPLRLYHALLAAGLVTLSTVVPLSGFAAADQKAHSPLLYGVSRIEQELGSPGNGSLAVAAAAALGMLAVVAAAGLRPRRAATVAVAVSLVLCAGASAAAVAFDHANSRAVRNAFLPADPSWVDHAGVGDVTLVRSIGGIRGAALEQLFWNRSVKRVALLPGAPELDAYRSPSVEVAADGALSVRRRPLRGALLVDERAVTVRLRGARRVASAPGFALWKPQGSPRLALLFLARYYDGWLGDRGSVNLWPRSGGRRLEGELRLSLQSPTELGDASIVFGLPGGANRRFRVPAGSSVPVTLPVCSTGPWAAGFRSRVRGFLGDRGISVRASVPRFVERRGACAARPSRPREPATRSALLPI